MEPSLLAALEALIVRNRGARFEADIFSALFQDPKTIRSFEFGKVDGAIDCLDDIAPTTSQASEDDANHLQEQLPSFAKRFWDLDEQFKIHPRSRRLVPFDVKSTVYNVPHKQIYATTLAQSETTAFYICICAADPRYVELIPNVRYIPLQEGEDPKRKRVQVNSTKKSTLDSSVFGFLNPCDAPYRMPVALLPEAIRRIRNCANGREDYINPWTNCRFTGWIPFTIQSAKPLKPDEDSEHFTAFLATMEMYRAVQIVASQGLPIDFDFVALQPRLADLKLILRRQRQVFIQHKIAELGTKLSDVTITRNGKGYFSLFDR
jgi:hypothetical protein